VARTITEQHVSYQGQVSGQFRTYLAVQLRQAYKARLAYAFLAPAFLLMIAFIAYPLVRSLILSLYEWNGITRPEFVGLANFELLIQDATMFKALYNTLAFSVLTTAGTVIIGFMLAVAIERRVKGWSIIKVIYFLPVMISVTVVGLLWGQLFDPTFGPINVILKALGVASPPVWMGDPNITLYAIIGVTIWQYSGFPMIVFLAAMENIPLDIHDAATIDGVNVLQRVTRIIFPMIKHVVAVIVMLQIIFSLKVFDVIWVMTQGGPGEATTVLGIYLYRNGFIYTYFGYASAVAVLMTAIIFSLSMLYQRFIRPEAIEY
jgi:ABC-type sugar transport system permease subunit